MKTFIILILTISFFISCESPKQSETTGDQEQQQVREQEQTKKSRSKMKDDDRVSGFFDLQVDGVSHKSTQLQDNYCDMTFLYKGEKSFVTMRFKDVETDHALLLTFYGDEEFILDPSGTIETFMFSSADTKSNVQFVPGDGKGSLSSITMVEGSLDESSNAASPPEA